MRDLERTDRVGPRSLETAGSGSILLGHYDIGIYRDSRLNRQSNDPRNHLPLHVSETKELFA